MMSQRNYIAELTERVDSAKKSGQTVAEIQKNIPLSSIKAFAADGYGTLIAAGRDAAVVQAAVNTNIEHIYNRLGKS